MPRFWTTVMSIIVAVSMAVLSLTVQTSQADTYTHDPLCRGLKPGQDSYAQSCLKSYLGSLVPEKQLLKVQVSSDDEAFDALRKILLTYGGRAEALKELDYADFVGFAHSKGINKRLSYFLLDTGEFVSPKLVLDVNEKDLGLFFHELHQEPDVFFLNMDKFDLNY